MSKNKSFNIHTQVGANGPSGATALSPVDLGGLTGPGSVSAVGVDRQAFIPRIGRRKYVLGLSAIIFGAESLFLNIRKKINNIHVVFCHKYIPGG